MSTAFVLTKAPALTFFLRLEKDFFPPYIYAYDLIKVLTTHDINWMMRDNFCKDQYVKEQPKKVPSMSLKTHIFQIEPHKRLSEFEKFNFKKDL